MINPKNEIRTEIAVIPEPQSWRWLGAYFELDIDTQIVTDQPLAEIARQFIDSIAPALGFRPALIFARNGLVNSIHLHLDPALNRLEPEGYWLLVGKHEIHLTAASPSGIFYGTQTLRQLLPTAIFKTTPCPEMKWIIPGVEIEDAPRFAWRGVLLDVGRHFMPKDFILRMLDLLALHKMNTFHWHLTEDQGWRIEIKKYPRLTQVGARRKETLVGHANDSTQNKKFDGIPHQGFYTQAEIREVVEYARQRFITIVPEIEMPGHIQAALAAYPELGNTSQLLEVGTTWGINHHICNVEAGTIQFMQAVLSEVLDLFPGQYIHIGGDEVPTGEWRESPAAQKRLKELGLADETQLQGYFLRCMESFLHEHGRKLIGWDEILEDNLSREAAIMSWRCNGSDAIAANQDRQVVVASEKDLYLDHYQLQDKSQQPLAFGGYTPLSQVYQFEPVSAEILDENRKQILGVQAQLWSEYIPTPARMEYMAFPRLCAVAEIAWTNPQRKDYANFIQRLSRHEQRMDGLQVQYCQQNE